MEPLLLKAGEVARLWTRPIEGVLHAGELPVIRMGRSVPVPRA